MSGAEGNYPGRSPDKGRGEKIARMVVRAAMAALGEGGAPGETDYSYAERTITTIEALNKNIRILNKKMDHLIAAVEENTAVVEDAFFGDEDEDGE